jgi:hypothetical protein
MSHGTSVATFTAYATFAVQIALAIVGNLSNEKLLKKVPLSVNAQNAIMYTWGLLFLGVYIVAKCLYDGRSVFPVADFPLVFAPSIVMSIVSLSLLGISCSYVLKLCGTLRRKWWECPSRF